MSAKQIILAIGWLVIAVSGCVRAQQNGTLDGGTVTVNDKDIKVIDYEELKYPLLAQYVPIESEGVVVVRVNLDDGGKVVEAVAISGDDILIPDCLANVKKWRFQPNAAKTAVIVYNLRMLQGECKSASSLFTFQQPNLATVMGCSPARESPFKLVRSQRGGTVSDMDMKVLHYEELRYPTLAKSASIQGVVVVQVKLDDKGNVVEAAAISGNPALIGTADCLANAKKWRFQPSAQKTAVIVYNFRLVFGAPDQFIFQPPNFATITGAPMIVQTKP